MKYNLLSIFSLIIFITSCGQTNTLTQDDYKWMPYRGNEILIFKSNTGDTDTIFLLKKDTLMGYVDPLSINGRKYEVLSIFCKHSDPYMEGNGHRYLKNDFVRIEKEKGNLSMLRILVSAKDANFYRLTDIKIDSLAKASPTSLQTKMGKYDDVYVIDGEDYLGGLFQRSDFITKVYWSRSNGLIRYDKKDNAYWELIEKK
jgi:hypothetical protein